MTPIIEGGITVMPGGIPIPESEGVASPGAPMIFASIVPPTGQAGPPAAVPINMAGSPVTFAPSGSEAAAALAKARGVQFKAPPHARHPATTTNQL